MSNRYKHSDDWIYARPSAETPSEPVPTLEWFSARLDELELIHTRAPLGGKEILWLNATRRDLDEAIARLHAAATRSASADEGPSEENCYVFPNGSCCSPLPCVHGPGVSLEHFVEMIRAAAPPPVGDKPPFSGTITFSPSSATTGTLARRGCMEGCTKVVGHHGPCTPREPDADALEDDLRRLELWIGGEWPGDTKEGFRLIKAIRVRLRESDSRPTSRPHRNTASGVTEEAWIDQIVILAHAIRRAALYAQPFVSRSQEEWDRAAAMVDVAEANLRAALASRSVEAPVSPQPDTATAPSPPPARAD